MSRFKCNLVFCVLSMCFVFYNDTVFAEGCKDITGNWNVTGEEVCAIAMPETTFEYRDVFVTFEIINQNGCRFHGYMHAGEDSYPLTGSLLKKNEIVITLYDATFRGKMAGKKKMIFSFSDPADSPTIEQCTGSGVAEKSSAILIPE